MRIYKALAPIQALSFDLDDTLYPNGAVIAKAELAMQQQLAQLLPASFHNNSLYWFEQRKILAAEDVEVRHDVSRWRLLALERGLTAQGLSLCEAGEIAELAMSAFLQARTDIQLAPHIRPLLAQLAARFPLVAITNGNADIQQMGIGDLFQFALRAGPDGRMKPYPDMFLAAAQRLALKPKHILHIGDHVKSDVVGALSAGCQAAWLNLTPGSLGKLKTLPQLEVHQLEELTAL
jgi:putative hydrolase of the HAD superfamily